MNYKDVITIFEFHPLDVVGTPWNDRSYLYLGRRRIIVIFIAITITIIIIIIMIAIIVILMIAIKTCCFANSGKSARSDTPGPRAEPPKLIAHYDHDHND